MLGHANNSIKGASNSPLEVPHLRQFLSLEAITLGNQKHVCTGDVKRVLGLPLINMPDGNSLGVSQPRPFHPAATEELKNIKECVESVSRKAKDRSNMFQESIFKLEKYRDNLMSKKRQRSENVSSDKSGTESEKMGVQLYENPRDVINQRQDQRPKNSMVVKRVRTSICEARADSRVVPSPRQPSLLERNGERLQISNTSLSQNVEKIHKVASGGEVWEKKIKRKRSVTAVGNNRLLNGDGEPKPLVHAKPSADPKLRSYDGQTLRSKNCFGMSGTNRLGSRTESPGANTSALHKNEPDTVYSSPKDGMDMFEARVSLKGRENIQEGDLTSFSGSLIKGKLSRTPKYGSSTVADPSPSSRSMSGGCAEDYELPSKVNKVSPVVITGDKKHSLGSSSQPMAQWVGQRIHKKSRLRRANLVLPLLNSAEKTHNLTEDLGLLDYSARNSTPGNDGSFHDYSSIKSYAKVKKELEKSQSPFGVLESDESGACENGLKGNGTDGGEVSLTASVNTGDFVLPGKKQKWTSNEHGGRKQGISGRGLSQSKTGTPQRREKMEDSSVANLPQSLYHGSDKVSSKSGRTTMGKSKDRSSMTRVGPMLNGNSYECIGEFDDDRETLVAAAKSARNGSNLAFSGPFWPKIKLMFASVNVDNESFSFLKQQHYPIEEFNESMFSDVNHDLLGNVDLKDDSGHSGRMIQNQLDPEKDAARNNALSSKFDLGKLDKATPLYERILSALIEDENEEIYHNGAGKVLSLQCMSDDSHCGSCNHIEGEFRDRDRVESEVESTVDVCNQKVGFLDKVYGDKSTTSCSLKSLSTSIYSNNYSVIDDDYCHSDAGMVSETCSNDVGHMQKESSAFACSYPDSQYEMMSLDERLMLELRSIDLYPDLLPDLSEGGETIHNNIVGLRKDLRRKVEARKDCLIRIEKARADENVVERRKLEETAMYKLMEMAYKKRMACRGGNSSKAAVRKVSKQVALAFIKRTLARYRKYQDTGISSFTDPSLVGILFSSSTDAKSGDRVGLGTASNTLNDASNNNQQEARGSGAASSIMERRYPHSENTGVVLVKPGSGWHKGRKEMLIDDVGCASSKMALTDGMAKGKSGERQKNLNNAPNGKPKSKQKNNPHPTQRPVSRPESEVTLGTRANDMQMNPSNDPLDLTKIGLDGNQDLNSLLDFDMDGEQDPEAIGLEIPPWDDVGLEVPPWDDQFVFGL